MEYGFRKFNVVECEGELLLKGMYGQWPSSTLRAECLIRIMDPFGLDYAASPLPAEYETQAQRQARCIERLRGTGRNPHSTHEHCGIWIVTDHARLDKALLSRWPVEAYCSI